MTHIAQIGVLSPLTSGLLGATTATGAAQLFLRDTFNDADISQGLDVLSRALAEAAVNGHSNVTALAALERGDRTRAVFNACRPHWKSVQQTPTWKALRFLTKPSIDLPEGVSLNFGVWKGGHGVVVNFGNATPETISETLYKLWDTLKLGEQDRTWYLNNNVPLRAQYNAAVAEAFLRWSFNFAFSMIDSVPHFREQFLVIREKVKNHEDLSDTEKEFAQQVVDILAAGTRLFSQIHEAMEWLRAISLVPPESLSKALHDVSRRCDDLDLLGFAFEDAIHPMPGQKDLLILGAAREALIFRSSLLSQLISEGVDLAEQEYGFKPQPVPGVSEFLYLEGGVDAAMALVNLGANFASNGMRYKDPEKEHSRVIVETRLYPDTVDITWIDNGIGMSPEKVRTFGTYGVKGDHPDSHGFGVNQCFDYLKNNNFGPLYVRSKVGVGTQIRVSIPRKKFRVAREADELTIGDDVRLAHQRNTDEGFVIPDLSWNLLKTEDD